MAEVSNSYLILPSELLFPKPQRYRSHLKASNAHSNPSMSDVSVKNQLFEELNQIIHGKHIQKKLDPSSKQWKLQILAESRSSNPIIEDELFKKFDKEMSP